MEYFIKRMTVDQLYFMYAVVVIIGAFEAVPTQVKSLVKYLADTRTFCLSISDVIIQQWNFMFIHVSKMCVHNLYANQKVKRRWFDKWITLLVFSKIVVR